MIVIHYSCVCADYSCQALDVAPFWSSADTRPLSLLQVKPSPPPEQTERLPLHGAPLQSSSSRCSQSAGAGRNPQPSSQSTRTGFKSSFIPSSRHVQFRHHQCVASEGSASRGFFLSFYMQQETRRRLPVWPLQTEGHSLCSDPNQNNKRTIFKTCLHCVFWLLYVYLHTLYRLISLS